MQLFSAMSFSEKIALKITHFCIELYKCQLIQNCRDSSDESQYFILFADFVINMCTRDSLELKITPKSFFYDISCKVDSAWHGYNP